MHSTPQDNPGGISSWLDQPVNGRQAVVDWTPEESLVTLSFGFATAARELADAWPEVRNDAVVVPIVYLYRHAVELSLKGAIETATKYLERVGELPDDGVPVERLPEWFRGWGKNKSWPLKPGHNLEQLTSYLCHLLAQPALFPDDPSGLEPDHTWGRLILDLHELDRDGSGLRYAEQWDRQRSAMVPSGRPGLRDVERPPNVLLDVEVMAADFAALLGRIGAVSCRIAEARLAPLDEAER